MVYQVLKNRRWIFKFAMSNWRRSDAIVFLYRNIYMLKSLIEIHRYTNFLICVQLHTVDKMPFNCVVVQLISLSFFMIFENMPRKIRVHYIKSIAYLTIIVHPLFWQKPFVNFKFQHLVRPPPNLSCSLKSFNYDSNTCNIWIHRNTSIVKL